MEAMHILVVEPDSDVRWLFADLLQRRGYQVSTFADDHDVLAFVKRNDLPRCLLLDLRAPPPGGHPLHRRLTEDDPDPPVLSAVVVRGPLRLSQLVAMLDEHAPRVPRSRSNPARDRDPQP